MDDDPIIMTVLSGILSESGYTVACASGGTEALRMLSQESFSCVLMDLYMDDISGLDVLMEVRQTWDSQTLPILMISSEDDDFSAAVARDFGANDYLKKPIDAESLRSKVQSHLLPTRIGPYEIQSLLRRSGQAAVYRALDVRLLRTVEVKVAPQAESEALILAQIRHPNVVVIYDIGSEPSPFLVTESLDGTPMTALAGARLTEVLGWTRGVLLGLAAVHERGYVHAALKPEHLILSPAGQVTLMDFSSARKIADPGDVRVDLPAGFDLMQFCLGEVSPELEDICRHPPTAPLLHAALRPYLSRALRA